MELIQMLTSQLGVDDSQAEGGLGLLLGIAKEKLGAGDFAKVAETMPGVEGLVDAAPQPSGLGGALGGLASSFGGGAGQLGQLAGLASGFKGLGLDSEMVGKFVPVILSYVRSKGGDGVAGLLEGVLK